MKIFFLIIAFGFSLISKGQFGEEHRGYIQIPTSKIDSTFSESLYCIDNAGRRTSDCPVCLESYSVEFFKAYYNKATKKIILIGRTTFPDIDIYITNNKDSIQIDRPISISSSFKHRNFGFFDIEFELKNDSELVFNFPQTFAIRYSIGKLTTK